MHQPLHSLDINANGRGNGQGENDAYALAWSILGAAGQIPVKGEQSATKRSLWLSSSVHAQISQFPFAKSAVAPLPRERGWEGEDRTGQERKGRRRRREENFRC